MHYSSMGVQKYEGAYIFKKKKNINLLFKIYLYIQKLNADKEGHTQTKKDYVSFLYANQIL